MRVDDLAIRYDYGYWANRKLFDVISQLSPEQFTRGVAGGWGSIRTTMVHVLSAEWGWLSRCGGRPERPSRLDPATLSNMAFPDGNASRGRLTRLGREWHRSTAGARPVAARCTQG